MSNPIGTFWSGVDADVASSLATLGAVDSGRAEPGKVSSLKTPGILTWIDIDEARIDTHAGVPLSISTKLIVFCVGAGRATIADATDHALEMAMSVLSHMAGRTIGGAVLSLSDTPIDFIEAKANRPVTSVTFDCTVEL